MKRIILFFTLLFSLFCNLNAQKLLDFKNYDTLVHVYKLNYEQTKYLLKDGYIRDTSLLFTNQFKQYSRNFYKTDSLPEGHFLIAQVNDNLVSYSYFFKTPFFISPKVIDEDVVIYLSLKKDKQLIKDAEIEIDGNHVKYDAGYGGFSFPKKSINKEALRENRVFLKISYKDEVYVFKYTIQEGAKPTETPNYYNNTDAELNSPGYVILDKPMYKPLDTLNLKSFLINYNNGNAIRKKAHLMISEEGQNFSFSKKIKRTSPGAYLFQWKIPDTLKLNRDYNVKLWYTKNGRTLAKYTRFKLEEYELNKNKYEIEMPSDVFYAGDDVKFYATAKDLNGFPVQGTRIHYKLRVNEVQELFLDTLTLTQNKKLNWYGKDTVVEYENFIELKIPSESLLNANAKYTLEITFVDPVTYEKKVFEKTFMKYTQKEKLLFFQQEDSLHVRNLYNSKDTNKNYYFITFRGTDTISKKNITTPFHYKLTPYETNAIIIDKDSFKTSINIAYNKLDVMHAKGKRTGDSILISFAYPFAEPIHYRIYKKGKLIQSGESNTLKFAMLDKSADDYRIVMTSNLQNKIEDNFYEMKFVPEKNILHFEKKMAVTALPGDSMAVELKALDYKNQPIKNVNIAAYAVNAAFANDIQIPYVEVPSEYRNKIEINPLLSRDGVYLKSEANAGNVVLKNEHFTRFNLRKNEYYLLKYPLNELTEIKIKKQQAHPEFALVLTVKNSLFSPRYILLDEKPIYISDLHSKKIYSFATTPGKHTIKYRYFNKTIELKDLDFQANTKHIFGINVDSIKKEGSRFAIVDSLKMLEPTDAEKKLLYSTLLLTNTFNAELLEVNNKDLNLKNKIYSMYEIPRLNIDGEAYFVQGCFPANSLANIVVNHMPFKLKTGIDTVYHYDNILNEFVPKPLGKIKGAFLHFSETPLQLYALGNLIVPDTLLPQPVAAPMKYKPETAKALQIKEEENFYQSYTTRIQDGFVRFIIDNKNDTNYIKSIWIISRNNFEACDYFQTISRGRTEVYRRAINEPFDVYFFYNKNKIAILRNQKHDNQNEFYINASLLKTVNFSKEKIEEPLKIYAELNAVPLLPFYDAPYETKEKIKQSSQARNNIYFHGMITDENQTPLVGALVYVEINGKYKYGAVTNNNGLFEILDILPATYQIKIYHPDYAISHFEPVFFGAHSEIEINTSLKAKGLYHPLFEVVQPDFRMMAYIKSQQKDILKITVHEKETRAFLDNVQVNLIYNNQILKTYTINENSFEMPFPKSKEAQLYSLEISKPGYTSLKLNNIEFTKEYTYILETFIGLEKKEILKRKEFDVNMKGQLPEYEKPTYTVSADAPVLYKKEIEYSYSGASPTAYYAPMQAGSYQNSYTVSNIGLADNISYATPYTIDAIQATDLRFKNLEALDLKIYEDKSNRDKNTYADTSMIDQVINNKNASTIRKKFSDVGYWKPNLITNKNGVAAFTVKLPDNITAWKSYFIGVGKHWLHGIDEAETKVYKPLQTICLVPSYVYKNDKVEAKIKYQNLMKDALTIQSKVSVNGMEKVNKNVLIKNTYLDSILIEAETKDTVSFEGGLVYKEKYKDFEHYDIPVLSTAMKYFSNQNFLMEVDSTYKLNIAPNTKGSIIFNNTLYEKVISVVDELNKYEYGCVEQTASKLAALLVKEKIQRQLKLKSTNTKDINNLLARLVDMQNADGSFGWWRNSNSNNRMTIYVMEVTYDALKYGFLNNVYNSTRDYVTANYQNFSNSDKIYAYHIYVQGSYNSRVNDSYATINTDFLNTTDKIYHLQNKMTRKEEVKKEDLYAVFLEMNSKVNQPYYDNFFYDYKSDIFKAYSLFKNTPFAKEFTDLFKKKLVNGQFDQHLNTYSKAKMIEALMFDAMTDTSKPIQSKLTINDSLTITSFPYKINIAHNDYKIKHVGGDVFLNTSEENLDENPTIHDSVFSVRTSFIQNNEVVSKVKAGINCLFTIDVQSYKSGENVMIEIPIPSGMKVIQKTSNFGKGDYVEYYKHKVVYYFEKLPMGMKQLSINVMPLFKGEFVLPATKASLMYYPFVFGNSVNKKIVIQ